MFIIKGCAYSTIKQYITRSFRWLRYGYPVLMYGHPNLNCCFRDMARFSNVRVGVSVSVK